MLEPLTILAGNETVGTENEAWSLADFGEADGDRSYVKSVTFERPFTTPPVVNIALSGFDVSEADCLRLAVTFENVTATAFEVRFRTWLHTRVFWASVSWLAVGR